MAVDVGVKYNDVLLPDMICHTTTVDPMLLRPTNLVSRMNGKKTHPIEEPV